MYFTIKVESKDVSRSTTQVSFEDSKSSNEEMIGFNLGILRNDINFPNWKGIDWQSLINRLTGTDVSLDEPAVRVYRNLESSHETVLRLSVFVTQLFKWPLEHIYPTPPLLYFQYGATCVGK